MIGTALCCREFVLLDSVKPGLGHSQPLVPGCRARLPGEYVDYAASKAAVDTLTRGLGAGRVADRGIRVNSVRPGIIATEIHALGGGGDAPNVSGRRCRWAAPAPQTRWADAVVWLLSPQSRYVTGSTVDVSGGR